MTDRRAVAARIAVTVTLTLALAGCTPPADMTGMQHSTDAASATASADDADVMFAQMMIPHHQQAVEMSQMLLAKDGVDDRVRAIAQRIEDAQAPEIATMTAWLVSWGATPPTTMSGMSGMAATGGMDGMMSDADMAALDAATGAVAAQLFLTQMQQHHAGAIAMAQAEIDAGSDPDADALAHSIVESQTAEIAEMKALATELG